MSNKHLPTNTPQPIAPHNQVRTILLPRERPNLGREIKIHMTHLTVDMDLHAEFASPFEQCAVEIGAMDMPVGVPVLLLHLGYEICFTEDFAVAIVAEDKGLGVDAVLFEFGGYPPSFQ